MNVNSQLAIGLVVLLAVNSAAADEAKPQASQDSANRLREIIEHVRQEEGRYQNLETMVRIVSRDEVSLFDLNDRQNVSQSEETRYTLQQGDLFLFKSRMSQTIRANPPVVSEQVAAYDGDTTRMIFYGNCVNEFAGRREPSRLQPPHSWALRPVRVNYPLSVYLEGTDAINKHPKTYKSPAQRGTVFEIAKVEVSFLGDGTVEDLECVILQCRHWFRQTDQPQVLELWLARERNYHCAKVDISAGASPQGTMRSETKVAEWAEIEPGLWLPKKIETAHYVAPRNGGKPVVQRSETLLVERANVTGKHPVRRFADLKPPKELPVFKIDRDGFLEGSAIKSVSAPAGDPKELDRIIAELKREEEKYARFDVSTTATYRVVGGNRQSPGVVTESEEAEHTISLPGKLYCDCVLKSHSLGGVGGFAGAAPLAGGGFRAPRDSVSRTEAAWDGQWIRSAFARSENGTLPAAATTASLRKGGPKGLNAFRPHTALFSDHRMRCRLLSDFLTAEYWDEGNKYRYLVEYLEEELVNDLRCAKLRLGSIIGQEKEPKYQFFFLWLAKDRNYLAVRSEHVDLTWSDRLSTGAAYVDELREVAPGLWFPYRVVEIAHNNLGEDGLGSGQVVINWRRDRQIDSLSLDPDVSDELFVPAVDSGTEVFVAAESGRSIGRFRQKEYGPAQVADDKYQVMAEIASIDWRDPEDRKRRQASLDALVGTPLPEFDKATWLNGPPLGGKALAGKVLLIEFCAEWWQPCHGDLETLGKANRGLAADGVTIVGVHTAGSGSQDIEDLAARLGVDFPICLDAPETGGKSRWGRLFEKLRVRELPHAFVVDRDGKIAAHGRLDQMIRQAQLLAEKK